MSDLVQIARSRIDDTQRTHWEGCERDHRECLIQRMADEIERLRATLERQQISYEREREIDQEEIERLIALRRDDARALERMRALIAEAEVIAEYGRDVWPALRSLTTAREQRRTMFARRPGLWALQAREVLELIAAPRRPDGTWNRDREACRQMAAEALGRYED